MNDARFFSCSYAILVAGTWGPPCMQITSARSGRDKAIKSPAGFDIGLGTFFGCQSQTTASIGGRRKSGLGR